MVPEFSIILSSDLLKSSPDLIDLISLFHPVRPQESEVSAQPVDWLSVAQEDQQLSPVRVAPDTSSAGSKAMFRDPTPPTQAMHVGGQAPALLCLHCLLN